jgi:hypothetical protein
LLPAPPKDVSPPKRVMGFGDFVIGRPRCWLASLGTMGKHLWRISTERTGPRCISGAQTNKSHKGQSALSPSRTLLTLHPATSRWPGLSRNSDVPSLSDAFFSHNNDMGSSAATRDPYSQSYLWYLPLQGDISICSSECQAPWHTRLRLGDTPQQC